MRGCLLLLAGCGRIGFGLETDAPSSALAITAPATMLPLTAERLTANAPVPAPPSIGVNGRGMLVAAYGIGMILVELTASGVPAYAFWDGAAWSAWTELAVAGADRDYLAGADGPRPALIWTQAQAVQGLVLP